MMTYYKKEELQRAMKTLVEEQLESCLRKNRLSKDCSELIRHNFLAKFVHYNEKENMIEIGVEDTESESSYPEIKVYKYPVNGDYEWLLKSIKTGKDDLAFYGRILNGEALSRESKFVVI